MKKEDFKPAIIKYFEDNSGLSLEVAKKQITNKMKASRDGSEYIKAEPINNKGYYSFGGTYITCSDSRVKALSKYPIPLHDRDMSKETGN